MNPAKYPIIEIENIPAVMKNQGYRTWYWNVGGMAFTSPLEALIPQYWKAVYGAALVYGLCFPGKDPKNPSDLLILVSQDWKFVEELKGKVNFPDIHQIALFALILEIEFPQMAGIKELAYPVHDQIRRTAERTFNDYIYPRIDKSGKYYRGINDIEKYPVQELDDEGRIKCPVCGKLLSFGENIMFVNGYQGGDKIHFMNAVCQLCGEPFGVRLFLEEG